MPEDLLQALCGYFFLTQRPFFALGLMVAIYGVLRTRELLALRARHVHVSPARNCAVINLGFTKTSQRLGTADSVTVCGSEICHRLPTWKNSARPDDKLIAMSDYLFRKVFDEALRALSMESWGFRPYGLGRGGATMYFSKNPRLDYLRLLGRWSSDKTVRVYINDGLAQLAQMEFNVHKTPFQRFFLAYHAQTRLVHVSMTSRVVERGKLLAPEASRVVLTVLFSIGMLLFYAGAKVAGARGQRLSNWFESAKYSRYLPLFFCHSHNCMTSGSPSTIL